MKKSLTLIEVLLATLIFSILSVSLYIFLHTGIIIRKKIELQDAYFGGIYLNLERIAHELRNVVSFKKEDFGLRGDSGNIEFYSLNFDYSADLEKILHITYNFNQGTLSKTLKSPLGKETIRTLNFIENIEKVNFHYFNGVKEEWEDEWKNKVSLPQGVKIKLTYQDEEGRTSSLEKYVCIYSANGE